MPDSGLSGLLALLSPPASGGEGEKECGGNTIRRALLGGLAGLALAPRARPPLISQRAARYRPTPNGGMSCALCTFFRPPGSCAVVAGRVSPYGWCKFFDLSD